ncbi:MAG: hypothetical protein MUF49_08405 [Oculatellaceae cyanobacterium Prado106]|jgi:seryl-tRNA synthetase|nr:hypothetical protein [Oculatellaceae cyanobacterium Prado106]
MSNKAQWIREIALEINCPQSAIECAIQEIGMEIDSKDDVLLCYAKWSVPKLKIADKKERRYVNQIYELEKFIKKMTATFNSQQEDKDSLVETQNEIIAKQEETISEKNRIIAKMEELLRGLPLVSGD